MSNEFRAIRENGRRNKWAGPASSTLKNSTREEQKASWLATLPLSLFLARCTLPMRLRSHAPLAREILLELLHSLALERPFVAWKKINRRKSASLGRTDGSNNYGNKEHLHKCLSERERKYLKKVGPENEETSSPCNELEIFPSSSSSSTWPRSSLPASYRANLL